MTPERWKKVEEVFESALEHAPDERSAYLAEVCAGDEALRHQVETLIASNEQAGSFIEAPIMGTVLPATVEDDPIPSMIGRRVGSYKIVREIGRGGMGAVYLAVRADDEFQKRVAIKLIKRGMDTDYIIRRFRNERQILASLDHPNIARLLDGGTTEDGLPYFVMEYVEGQPLHHYCDTKRLSTVERLRLFLKVCSAVHYAHQNLIIHRDLKPSNILVTADGTPKLLDFGIAKLLNPEIASQTLDPTTMALRLMTPEYASPEQVRGEPATTASDVYSLGVLLYELLTGRRPYRIRNRLPEEIARVICEEEPERPSIVINRIEQIHPDGATQVEVTPESVSRRRDGTPETLRRQLAGDLDNIVLKALRKEPQRRYSSVEQLAEDINRHLEGLPVSAPPYFLTPARSDLEISETPTGSRSIAVIPFKMLGIEEKSDGYLALGMADALITKLSNIRRIIVRPTSSILKYAEGEHDLLVAGHELGVEFILDGRIQRVSDRVRVTVQLVRVRDGATLWAAKFDEKFTDILNVEDSISAQLAQALMPKLTGEERELLSKRDTENAKAYQAYLKGRYYWNSFTEEGLAKAIMSFMEAIAEDPDYAQAYAGVADYYNGLGVWGVLPPKDSFPAAKEAAIKALELDDTLAEAHTSLAFVKMAYDWDWAGAEREFKRAIELNPSYATAHRWYSYLCGARGNHAEAITEMQCAQKLDPLSSVVGTSAALTFFNARQYDRTIEELQKSLALDPDNIIAQQGFGWAYAQKGLYAEAISALRKAVANSKRNPLVLWTLGHVLAVAGQHDEARDIIRELQEVSQKQYVSPYYIAMIYAGLGERDEAFAWLERTFQNRDWWLLWLGVEPRLDSLRSDPRFDNLLQRIGLDEAKAASFAEVSTNPNQTAPATGTIERPLWWRSRSVLALASAALVAVVAAVTLFYFMNSSQPKPVRSILRLTNSSVIDSHPEWSPNMSKIAFASARDGKMEIYLMDADGSNVQRLTFNSADDFVPVWAPKGTRIAFTSKRDNNDEIYLMNADGSNQKNISNNAAADSRPCWSPDGKKIAFTSNRGDKPEDYNIYVMGADGNNQTRLTDDPAFDSDPAWSPDGSKIAFSSNRTGNFEVHVMNADGSQQTNISRGPSFSGKPVWSPDGKKIAFTSNRSGNFEIYVMNADGSGLRRLTNNPATDDEPAWSSDGRQITFQSERDGNLEIYVIDASVGESQPGLGGGGAGIRSIAVLPFKTLEAEGDTQYLGAGLADLLSTKLSQIKQLTVRPPSEVRRYINTTIDPERAGHELGVDCVLSGEVRQNGDRVEVTASLVNVRDGSMLWSEKFDQSFTDISTVQDSISDRVARAMLLELTNDERKLLAKRYTDNGEAYQLYLIGRYHSGRRTPEGLKQAIKYFEQAINKDQNYALAYAGLADSYGLLALYDVVSAKESFLKSKEAALKAIEIDNTLAEAHTSLGFVKLYHDLDFAGAEQEFKTAIDLKPNYSTAHHWYALNLSAMGRHDHAIAEIKRAQELDPLSLIINTAVGNIYYYAGQYENAIEQCLKTVEMDQKFAPAHTILRQAYEKKGLSNEAFAEYQKERALLGETASVKARLGHVHASAGKRAEALKVVNELIARRQQQIVSAYEIAQIFALLGEEDQALEWLAKAGEERSIGFAFVKVDPDFNRLRGNPRFAELLQRVGHKP